MTGTPLRGRGDRLDRSVAAVAAQLSRLLTQEDLDNRWAAAIGVHSCIEVALGEARDLCDSLYDAAAPFDSEVTELRVVIAKLIIDLQRLDLAIVDLRDLHVCRSAVPDEDSQAGDRS